MKGMKSSLLYSIYHYQKSIKNRAQRARFSNTPLKGCENAFTPRGGKVESSLAYFCLYRQLIFILQTFFLAFLGTLHTCESFLHQDQRYRHNNHVPKNGFPQKGFFSFRNLFNTRIAVRPLTVPMKIEIDIFGGMSTTI